MAVYLDDQEVRLDGATLGAMIASAKQQLDSAGRAIVEVQLDGQALVGDELTAKQNEQVQSHELRLYSANPAQLGVAALEQVRAALDQARDMQSQAAELLQQDQSVEALKQVSQAFEIWMHVQQAVSQAAAFVGLALDRISVDERSATELINDLIEQLKALRQLLIDGDTVAMADVLAYEWPHTVDQWQALIAQIIKQIEQEPTSTGA